MKEPTQEQIKIFWEYFGIEFKLMTGGISGYLYWKLPQSHQWELGWPDIDLNNLFKHAVPKLKSLFEMTLCKIPNGYQWQIHRKPTYGHDVLFGEGTTEALALFWAIYKVIEPSSRKG